MLQLCKCALQPMNVFLYVSVCSTIDVNCVLCLLPGQNQRLAPVKLRSGELSQIVHTMHVRARQSRCAYAPVCCPLGRLELTYFHSISTDVRTARRVHQMARGPRRVRQRSKRVSRGSNSSSKSSSVSERSKSVSRGSKSVGERSKSVK